MYYVLLTGVNLVWIVLNLIADMLIATAIVTPKWLVSNYSVNQTTKTNATTAMGMAKSSHHYFPSVGIYTRCKMMLNRGFQCGTFDLDGFSTDNRVYPGEWKACMFFTSLGFAVLSLSLLCSISTCCKQAAFGKSLHKITACLQVISAIFVMLGIFLHAFGWGSVRVQKLCGSDVEPFYPGDCNVGISFYSAVVGVLLILSCAVISHKAERSHWRRAVKRRIEEGDRIVCIP